MIFLTVEEVLHIATRVLGTEPGVRDVGLIESAVARPEASVFGEDAYPTIHEKAAALLHSLVQNHALVDGNKRLGLAGVIAFYGINGWRFEAANDEAYDLVIDIATGELREVVDIAERLRSMVSSLDGPSDRPPSQRQGPARRSTVPGRPRGDPSPARGCL